MTKNEYIAFHKEFCDDMVKITHAKNADYTGGNGDPFANFRAIGGLVAKPGVVEIGFLTRMSDKMARIGSFINNGTLMVKDESVIDTLKDLANYSALFAGYLAAEKPIKEAIKAINETKTACRLEIDQGPQVEETFDVHMESDRDQTA